MDGNLGLTGVPLAIVKGILYAIIMFMIIAIGYIWTVAIPEQQKIIDENTSKIEAMNGKVN